MQLSNVNVGIFNMSVTNERAEHPYCGVFDKTLGYLTNFGTNNTILFLNSLTCTTIRGRRFGKSVRNSIKNCNLE